MSDDARGTCSTRESFSPFPAFSFVSEKESADSVHSGLGVSLSAQHDSFPGYNLFDSHNIPHSPIPDSAHPWDEIQPQSYDSISIEKKASSQDKSTSRNRCDICKVTFADKNGLKRHLTTTHEYGKTYWVCTVKSCRKYDIPNPRKDNFTRHCRKKHPTVDLKRFGL